MDSTIKGSFWTDARVEEAPAEVKLAALWLISNPARDLCGFTTVSNKRFEFETGLSASSLQGAVEGLPSSFVKLPGGVWFAVNFLRHQFGKGGQLSLKNNVIVAATRHASKLPEPLRRAFFEAYPELVELVTKGAQIPAQSEPPPEGVTPNPEGVRVRVRVREGEGAREEGCGEKPDLLGIVHSYPRRENDMLALEAVRASLRKGASAAEILAGTKAVAAVIPSLPSGHLNAFVVSAGRFFRDERWRDDPQTWKRHGGKNGVAVGKLDLGGRKAVPMD